MHKETKQFDAVIFDVDGVLWDSTELVAGVYNAVFEKEKIDRRVTGNDLKGLFGRTMDVIFDILLPQLKVSQRRSLQLKCIDMEQKIIKEEAPVFYEEIPEVIKKLSERYPIYIVSNSQKGYIEEVIDQGNLQEVIKGHLCFGDTGTSKGETLKLLMEREGLKSPVYVGDIQGDADACRIAGIEIIWASYGFGNIKEPWDTINKPRELLEKI